MKGHIRERSPGHWAIVIDAQDAAGTATPLAFLCRNEAAGAGRMCPVGLGDAERRRH